MKLEQNFKRLDVIIESLSSSEVSLEESLKLYEEGMQLANKSKSELDNAKLIVQKFDTD